MPYEVNFAVDNFDVRRADESSGDEPYLFVVCWGLDGDMRVEPSGAITGTPKFELRGGVQGNLTSRSLTADSDPIRVPADVGQASMHLTDVNWRDQVARVPGLADHPRLGIVPNEPIAGMTVVAIEEDATPAWWIEEIFSEIRQQVQELATDFVTGLRAEDLLNPVGVLGQIQAFQNNLTGEMERTARSVASRIVGRFFLRIFRAPDADNFVGSNSLTLPIGLGSAQSGTLLLGTVTPPAGGLSGGGGFASRGFPLYAVDASITATALAAETRPAPLTDNVQVTISFDGRDDERRGRFETHNPAPSTFQLEPGRRESIDFRWGGEMRAEYDFAVSRVAADRVLLRVDGRLFEGASESTSDLDGEGSITLDLTGSTPQTRTFKIINTDEDEPGDFARLQVTAHRI